MLRLLRGYLARRRRVVFEGSTAEHLLRYRVRGENYKQSRFSFGIN